MCRYRSTTKPKITEADLELLWQPVIWDEPACPQCGGEMNEYTNWIQVDSRPWAQEEEHAGYICHKCNKVFADNEYAKVWVKSYHIYDLLFSDVLKHEAEFDWLAYNSIYDFRKYPDKRG